MPIEKGSRKATVEELESIFGGPEEFWEASISIVDKTEPVQIRSEFSVDPPARDSTTHEKYYLPKAMSISESQLRHINESEKLIRLDVLLSNFLKFPLGTRNFVLSFNHHSVLI